MNTTSELLRIRSHCLIVHCCRPSAHHLSLTMTFAGQNYRNASHKKLKRVITAKSSPDEVLRSMSENGEVSCLVVNGTRLVQEACDRHRTAPTASAALGRTLLGTLLIAGFKAEGEKTQVTFHGNGLLQGIQAIGEATGLVKGKVGNPSADPPLQPSGKLDVGAAVGRGTLAVVRSHPEWERPYTGIVELASGEIAEDLAKYLLESEQQNAAIALGVSINRDSTIRAAGGYLLQVLPFASEETLSAIERNVTRLGSVTEMMHRGMSTQNITEELLEGIGTAGSSFSMEPTYGPCEPSALKERMKRAVALLGESEVEKILQEQGKIEVTCEFCKSTYEFGKNEVMEKAAAEDSTLQQIKDF